MRYLMVFKDSVLGVKYIQRDGSQTADIETVKEFMKGHSGLGWFKRRSYIRELQEHGITGHTHKKPREGKCDFIIVRAP